MRRSQLSLNSLIYSAKPGLDSPIDTLELPSHSINWDQYRKSHQNHQKRHKKRDNDGSEYNFSLISVAFKEAALDSPSFRATINHLDTQVAQTEDWFVALADLFVKVPRQIEDLSSVFAILDYVVPSFLQDSVVDQEYCLATLYRLRETLKKLWDMAFSVFKINTSTIEQKKVDFSRRVARFRRLRWKFLMCQKKYDRYYQIHMSTPKFKDAELLYEDSLQLSSVRREYLLLSLELVVEAQKLSENINQTILSLNEVFWKIKIGNLGGGLLDQQQLDEIWGSVKRVRAWHDACHRANSKLYGDLQIAKMNIEDEAVDVDTARLSCVDDYRPELLNGRLLDEIDDESVEKFGYLCMKTYSEKASKPTWVKRWSFVKNGVLGFLVLSPSLESVQETDKIGVLLCNVKYTPNEDRHFCFEVRTMDTTIVLQAETLYDLKLWLKVFSNLRNRIVDETDPLNVLLDVARSRYPPLVAEFLAPLNTQMDRNLISKKTVNFAGETVRSRLLSKHLDRNEPFEQYIMESITRITFPIVTSATRAALLAGSMAAITPLFPTALDANISGSVNWGLAAMNGIQPNTSSIVPLDPADTKQIGAGILYPKNFPNAWTARDFQMRGLFEATVGPNEYCLLAYNCLLSPNETQELRAAHFVTQEYLYSYIHTLGFVSMSKMPLKKFVEANCTSSKSQDIVRLTLVHGQLVMKLYLDDGMLVERKLSFLFQNLACDNPLGTIDAIEELLTIERKYAEEKIAVQSKQKQTEMGLPTHVEAMRTGSRTEGNYFKSASFDFSLPLVEEKTIGLPPKAVFHVLCGSESEILNRLNAMVDVQFSERRLWKKSRNTNNYLIRDNESHFRIFTGQTGRFNVTQEVEIHVDNEFYSIKVTKSALKIVCGPGLLFITRITVQKVEAERSVVRIYGQPIVDGIPVYRSIARHMCRVFVRTFSCNVLKEIDVAANIIGTKGKILKAVYFYGKILVDQHLYMPAPVYPVPVGCVTLAHMCMQLITADVVRTLTAWCFAAINAMRLVFRNVTAHAGLLAVICMLFLSNVYFSGLSARNYWISRQLSNLIKELVNVEPLRIQRAVYLKDLVNESVAISKDSACFRVFKKQSMVLNHDCFVNWNNMFESSSTSMKSQQLREKLIDIAVKRNDLLVSLKMLNHLEEEEALSEWRTWLLDEMNTCNHISHLDVLKQGEMNETDHRTSMKMLGEYCDSCTQEMAALIGVL